MAASDLSGGINEVLRSELLYKTYRIRLLSQLQKGVWYPEALIISDTATGSISTSIYYKQPTDEGGGGPEGTEVGEAVDG